jgi:hypothetical protein
VSKVEEATSKRRHQMLTVVGDIADIDGISSRLPAKKPFSLL